MLNYWQWIEQEARAINADGCTGVSEWHRECCFEHDLACRYGKDDRAAYAFYTVYPLADDHSAWWALATAMSRRQADYMFATCNYEWSATKLGRVRSFFRFLGVRLGALLGIGVREPR